MGVEDPARDIVGMVGQFVDLETLVAYKDLMNKLNCDNLDVRASFPYFQADFRN